MGQQTLPADYIRQMKSLLGAEEAEQLLNSYDKPRAYGLRLNTLKMGLSSPVMGIMRNQFKLREVPWCGEGFYYEEYSRPGKHPYHAAGLYYIQEPSAMSAVELLAPEPGETVLDLAGAPGGKTTQIAAKMKGEGLLIANEIHPQRAKILAENVERWGIRNTVVTQSTPSGLSSRFPLTFDRIMLDAPCSGEGMFRKDPEAVKEWSEASVDACAARQWDILQDAIKMLKPGGRLAYSTCTFNRTENEETIARLVDAYPFMRLVAEKRVWPHLHEGEGHYVALLQRKDAEEEQIRELEPVRVSKSGRKAKAGKTAVPAKETLTAWEAFRSWAAEDFPGYIHSEGSPELFGEALYWLPRSRGLPLQMSQLSGLKLPRAGLHLGELRKGRFQPSHALAMASTAAQAARTWDLEPTSLEAAAFLRGETLQVPDTMKGWTLVTVSGYPIGFGKASAGQLKNHLPKGLRIHI
ncbi:RsmB/NOP family class I SAM-dependent RNA methyltransferase [Paenibacillus sp. YPG26]|uniref:RsmB/NOP family class I SAM-dependent RNA methyltransferase n=1 Tax=Paenibacillus sp. YPG26 TaxID=2878915 RepID=UPI00203E5C4D|nr:RsmB/NOP family class I SAM-dependent RNA methyltransferase [Paenibacillus sp. YPG26]USB35100.1 RsmB/NOP family class I SAM-dependent RNA methyltransferase [Paenibacillus sp. YPG26]